MAVAVSSKIFTTGEMIAGTAPTAWYVALGVTTLSAITTVQLGNGSIMMTAVWV